MATHSSTLACRMPWTEEPDGLLKEKNREPLTKESVEKDTVILINRWGKGKSPLSFTVGRRWGVDQGNYYRISIHGRVRACGLPHVLPYPPRQL